MYTHIGYNPPGVKEEIAEIDDRVSNLEVDVDDLQAILAANEQLDATQNNRLGAIEVVNTTQDTSIASLTTRITTNEQLDAAQNTRLNAIEAVNATQTADTASLTTRITTNEQLDAAQNTRLNVIEAVNATQTADIAQLRTDVNNAARVFTGTTPPANPNIGDYWLDGNERWIYKTLNLRIDGVNTPTNVWCLPLEFNQAAAGWGATVNLYFDLYQGRPASRVIFESMAFRGRLTTNNSTNFWRFLRMTVRGDADIYQSEISTNGAGTGFLNLVSPPSLNEMTHNFPAPSGLLIQALMVGAPSPLTGGLFAKCWYVRP